MQQMGYGPMYYGQGQPPGQFRPPAYPHMPPGGSPSFQSMTSHWNLTPSPSHPSMSNPLPPPQTAMSMGRVKQQGMAVYSDGTDASSLMRVPKQPKPPDKPLLPYMRYSRKMWEKLKEEGKRVWEVGKIIGQKWRELSDDEKQQYVDEYEQEKFNYGERVKAYQNSPAYRQWLEMKQQAEQMKDTCSFTEFGPPPPPVIVPPKQSPADTRMLMMLQQEDDEDEYITMKQVAAIRFHRNHRLMAELFNDVVVPDVKSVVNKDRIMVLRKQVQSLTVHQEKLDAEMAALEESFEAKKRKLLEDADKYKRELKKIQDNPPSTWKKPAIQLGLKDIPAPPDNAQYTKL